VCVCVCVREKQREREYAMNIFFKYPYSNQYTKAMRTPALSTLLTLDHVLVVCFYEVLYNY